MGTDQHKLVFPGIEGVPLRLGMDEQVPIFRKDDPPSKRPQLTWDAHVQVYDLNKPGQLEAYTAVMQLIARGQATFSAEERLPYKGSWKIFLRWWTKIAEMPRGRSGVVIVGGSNAKDIRITGRRSA